jgi:hypothetical protein
MIGHSQDNENCRSVVLKAMPNAAIANLVRGAATVSLLTPIPLTGCQNLQYPWIQAIADYVL